MFRKDPVDVTLSWLARRACAAAFAALLLPAMSAGAWAAEDTGIRWSSGNDRAGVYKDDTDHAHASEGHVTIYKGEPEWRVIGGYNTNNRITRNALFNSVTMHGGTVKEIYGGYSIWGKVYANMVTMEGGTVEEIYGGSSDQDAAYDNIVTITGGTVKSKIVGGYSPTVGMFNTVTLSGAPTLTGVEIYGGEGNSGVDHFTRNRLELDKYRGISKVNEVKNFELYNFTWDSAFQPLLVKDITFGNGPSKPSFVGYIDTIGPYVPKKITLISADFMNDDIKQGPVLGRTRGGAITVRYKWDVRKDGNNLVATLPGNAPANSFNNSEVLTEEELLLYGLGELEFHPETKSLLEGRLAGTVALTQAADMLAGQGMSAMLSSVSQSSFSIWGTVGGGTNRYNTGSHINSDGIGFMVGAAWRKCTGPGTLTLSPFFAFGWGNYTSHNSFASVGSVKGKGNTNYQGGGLMARYNHTNTGWYGEASVQLGHVKQDYKSSDFLDNYLNETKYAINQMYTSMHFGIGKEIALSNCSVLDVYGKYFWTHTGKKDKDIAGDDYTFAAVNSHRARFGARYTHTKATGSGEVKPYAGAAYEYEFNGKGRGTVEGYRIADTRLQGSTGLLEAGIDYAPTSKKWALNVGATGFVGKRRGILGQLGIRADF